MVIDCRTAKELGDGYYARVFEIQGRAYKLFRTMPGHESQEDERRRRFLLECRGYEQVQKHPELLPHTPVYYGRTPIEDVISEGGISIRDNFFLDCCYAMEVLTGPGEKVPPDWWLPDDRWDLHEKFIDAEIILGDADVFNKDNINDLKVIDFHSAIT